MDTVRQAFDISSKTSEILGDLISGTYEGRTGKADLVLQNAEGPDWRIDFKVSRVRAARKKATKKKAVRKKATTTRRRTTKKA